MTTPLDVQPPLVPVKLITGHEVPTHCGFCSAPRQMILEVTVAFACHTTATFQRQLPPNINQTLKCIALTKVGGWKRAA